MWCSCCWLTFNFLGLCTVGLGGVFRVCFSFWIGGVNFGLWFMVFCLVFDFALLIWGINSVDVV